MTKFKFLSSPAWRWGMALAAGGALFSRLGVPYLDPKLQVTVRAVAHLIAIGGLLTIAWGINRRMRTEAKPPPSGLTE